MSGVEGYVESAASGLLAGLNAAALASGRPISAPPRTTAIGALAYYASHADPAHYDPSNITFGIMEPLVKPPRSKMERKLAMANRALDALADWMRDRGGMIEHLKEFLRFLALNRNVSPHTVRAYDSDLSQFIGHVGGRSRRQAPGI